MSAHFALLQARCPALARKVDRTNKARGPRPPGKLGPKGERLSSRRGKAVIVDDDKGVETSCVGATTFEPVDIE